LAKFSDDAGDYFVEKLMVLFSEDENEPDDQLEAMIRCVFRAIVEDMNRNNVSLN